MSKNKQAEAPNRGKTKAPPKNSDAAKAAELEGGAGVLPHQTAAAADNAKNTEETRGDPEVAGELDEPAKVEDLEGGSGALPNSLEPAAENARKAAMVSELQGDAAQRLDNPNEVYREHLRKLCKKLGVQKSTAILVQYFGTDDPDKVGAMTNVMNAIDELHKALKEEGKE